VNRKLILASKSPRRLEILENVGISPEVIVSEVDEDIVDKTLPPERYVMELANLKSSVVAKKLSSGIVLGADTIVVNGEKILGQPKDRNEAYSMLTELSGRAHDVITGVSIIDIDNGRKNIVDFQKTKVYFKSLSNEEINRYIDSGEPMDKAGAYGIQGRAGVFVEKIDGCYFNVVGLPIHMVYEMLTQIGYKI